LRGVPETGDLFKLARLVGAFEVRADADVIAAGYLDEVVTGVAGAAASWWEELPGCR
jgi:hypothetical protein